MRKSTPGKYISIIRIKPFLSLENRQYLPHHYLDKGLKGTVVNPYL